MQAKDNQSSQDEALESLAAGKTKPKSSKLAKGKPGGALGEAIEQRHKKAGALGKSQAMQDLAAMGQSYSEVLAAGMSAFQGTASGVLDSMISDEFVVDADAEGGFDFLGESLTEALRLS